MKQFPYFCKYLLKFISEALTKEKVLNLGNHQSEPDSTQRRLGESLLLAGLLNPEQLDEAIEYQCIYGGKLGTSLIELGLIDENQLAKVLSKQLGQHYIKPEFLMNISASVLNIIPEKIALKYQIVPYHEDGKKLFVAMSEARNLTIIDELSFQLDRIVIPLAIPEIRLMLALKKYYGMLIPPRFESLSRQINRRAQAAKKISDKKKKNNNNLASPITNQKEEIPANDTTAFPLLEEPPFTVAENIDNYNFEDTAAKDALNTVSLTKQLANAQNRDDIAKAIINHYKSDFPNCALLMVHKDIANGWLATVENSKELFEQIAIPLAEPSIFNLVINNHTHYLGPITESRQNLKMIDFFDIKGAQDVIVFPLMVQTRVVCLLYIQGCIEDLTERLAELRSIADKVELSFKLLILKNKILTT